MKHRTTLSILFPVLTALFVLSIPLERNLSIRNGIGYRFSSFWRLIHSGQKKLQGKVPKMQQEAFFQWSSATSSQREKAQERAKGVLQEAGISKTLVGKVLY